MTGPTRKLLDEVLAWRAVMRITETAGMLYGATSLSVIISTCVLSGCSTTNVTNIYQSGQDAGDAGSSMEGGDAAVSAEGGDASGGDAGDGSTTSPEPSCNAPVTVKDTSLQQCMGCTPNTSCTSAEPLEACCTWVAVPKDALTDGIGLHRYSTNVPTAVPDLSCLMQPGTLGAPQTVTLTGYVWLFSSGQDSAGVQVDVFTENHPTTPDGSISASSLGTYTTSATDPIDPIDTSWNSKCPNGCSYRQYTIKNVPTETPLVIRTSDAGSHGWAARYEYGVYFSNSVVQGGAVSYDAHGHRRGGHVDRRGDRRADHPGRRGPSLGRGPRLQRHPPLRGDGRHESTASGAAVLLHRRRVQPAPIATGSGYQSSGALHGDEHAAGYPHAGHRDRAGPDRPRPVPDAGDLRHSAVPGRCDSSGAARGSSLATVTWRRSCTRVAFEVAMRARRRWCIGTGIAGAAALVGCGNSATWSPKNPDTEYPRAVELASRVHAARDACESANRVTLGVVHAEGDPDDVIRTLAAEAAAHGGTHYVIDGADDDVELVSNGVATQVGGATLVRARTHEEVTRTMWATVYRCNRER